MQWFINKKRRMDNEKTEAIADAKRSQHKEVNSMKSILIAAVLLFSGVIGMSDANADSRHYHRARTSVGVTFGPYWGPWVCWRIHRQEAPPKMRLQSQSMFSCEFLLILVSADPQAAARPFANRWGSP